MKNPHDNLTLKVIDKNGHFITSVVLVQARVPERDKEYNWVVCQENRELPYIAKDEGETLVFAPQPNFDLFCKPKWNAKNKEWVEGATDEEVAAWKTANDKDI